MTPLRTRPALKAASQNRIQPRWSVGDMYGNRVACRSCNETALHLSMGPVSRLHSPTRGVSWGGGRSAMLRAWPGARDAPAQFQSRDCRMQARRVCINLTRLGCSARCHDLWKWVASFLVACWSPVRVGPSRVDENILHSCSRRTFTRRNEVTDVSVFNIVVARL